MNTDNRWELQWIPYTCLPPYTFRELSRTKVYIQQILINSYEFFKTEGCCRMRSKLLQLIVFSIFMLFVSVSNGATSFCSLRLISEATKQNGMGHTTTPREEITFWTFCISIQAASIKSPSTCQDSSFHSGYVCTYLWRNDKIILCYTNFIFWTPSEAASRCSNILTPEPEPWGGNITDHFSLTPTCGQMPLYN